MARRNAKLSSLAKGDSERSPISFESNCLASAPKHVSLPPLPAESELSFELQTILLFMISMASQYLNLYRSVWWLPSSSNPESLNLLRFMNFHLIDLNVIHFNLIFMSRSLMQHACLWIASILPDGRMSKTFTYTTNTLILLSFTWLSVKNMYFIFLNHGVTGILCIAYPFIIYVLMYFPNLLQSYEHYRDTCTNVMMINVPVLRQLLMSMMKPITFSSSSSSTSSSPTDNNIVQHSCSSNTISIREEVDKLKTSFNDRLKFILFRSLIIAYFSSFVPLCLVQPQLFYDVTWTAQHVGVSWLSSFLLLTSHLYSPHFYDVLHKSSLHLGKWQKLETRNTLVPCTQWSSKFLYAQGVVVKHGREYFKGEGVANCAEPGNQSHLRFYVVFSNPIGGFGTLLGLLVTLILAQLFLLIRSHEWYKIVSMSSMIVVNSVTIFRLVRSYYVLREVYKVESNLQENSHLH